MEITYKVGNIHVNGEHFIELCLASGLNRPTGEPERMAGMLRNSNLVITAWDGEVLVGISRSMSDFNFTTYLSDLAVRKTHQKLGIGKELIRRTQELSRPHAKVLLLAAPEAADYYPHIGFDHFPRAWFLKAEAELK